MKIPMHRARAGRQQFEHKGGKSERILTNLEIRELVIKETWLKEMEIPPTKTNKVKIF